MQITLLLNNRLIVHSLGVLFAVVDIPLGKEVVLDPDDLAKGLNDGNLAGDVETRVRQNSLGQHVLNNCQSSTNMNIFDMQRVCATNTGMHHANFVKVLPKLHLSRVRAQLLKIGAEERLAVQNLGRGLVGLLVNRSLEGRAPGREGARGNIILQKLAVYNIDHSGNQRLDVLGAALESFNVVWRCPD